VTPAIRNIAVIMVVVVLGVVAYYRVIRGGESEVQGIFQGGGETPDLDQARQAVGVPSVVRGADKYSAGTGSLVSVGGRQLILVAFHIFIKRGEQNPSEQARVDKVSELKLVGASGDVVASAGRPLEMPRLGMAQPADASADFVYFEALGEPAPGLALPLASTAPLKDAPVWVVGSKGSARGKVELSSDRRLMIQLSERAPAGRLSGAPVINDQGEVVGSIALGGRGGRFIAAPLQALLTAAAVE